MSKNLYHHPLNSSHLDFLPTFDDLEFIPEGRGIKIRIPEIHIQNAIEAGKAELEFDIEHDKTNDPSDLLPTLTVTTRSPYSTLGKAMELVDINIDGETDLIVGSPGVRGCVYIILGYYQRLQEEVVYIEDVADLTICGKKEYGRFGSSLAIFDKC